MRSDSSVVYNDPSSKMKPLSCAVCGVKFHRKGHLTVHMRIHAANKRYPCEYCDAKFTQKGSYLAHLEIHSEPQCYVCKICEKRYAHKSSLDAHTRCHNLNFSFICQICNTPCDDIAELKDHMKIHPERKAVASATLGSSSVVEKTNSFGSTSAHIPQSIFMDERIMACDVCGSRFTNERALLAHKRFHRDRPSPSRIQVQKKKRKRLTYIESFDADEADEDTADENDQDVVEFMGIVDSFDQDISDVGDLHLSL